MRQTVQENVESKNFTAVRLNLNDRGDAITLKLLSYRIHICDLHIYGVQGIDLVLLF